MGRVVGWSLDWRVAASACVPESQNLELFGRFYDAVVGIVANPCEVQAAHAEQGDISCSGSDLRLRRNETEMRVQAPLEWHSVPWVG